MTRPFASLQPLWVVSIVAVVLAMPVAAAHAQALTADEVRRVDSVFATLDRTTSPGCALAIYRNGAIVYSRGYGMANLEHGIPITSRTVFDIGSTSKQFAATAIVLLAQDGKLSIDDDVRTFIPELPVYQRPITLRHMLNHTSGLRDYLALMQLHGTDFEGVTTDQDALDLIVRQKAVNFEPGSEFLYSNSGFFLLSQVVKRVSGKTLAQFAAERMFLPLGMRDTHFHDDHRMIVTRRAVGYSPSPAGFAIDMSLFEQTGDGAVYTTVEDLLHWDNNFYAPTLGGEGLLRDLHTQGRLNNGDTISYALGLFVDQHRGLRRVRHGGAWAGYRADLLRFPEARTSVACLCNLGTANPGGYADAVADVILRDRFAPVTVAQRPAPSASVAVSAEQLSRLEGDYRNAATGEQRRITIRSGMLATSLAPVPLIANDSLTFEYQATLFLSFDPGPDGKARRLTERLLNGPPQTFERFVPITLSPAQLQEYTGAYHAVEVDATYEVRADSTGLSLGLPGDEPSRLMPSVKDHFTGPGQLGVRFIRDARGRVTSFVIDAGRVRGIVAQRRP
jgi:CubicO group peptidase (beta-lactamase class C family)